MPSDQELIEAIERNLSKMHAYARWHIGTTDQPGRVEAKHGYPGFWRTWIADSEEDAGHVVTHFIERGMEPDPDRGIPGSHVYLF